MDAPVGFPTDAADYYRLFYTTVPPASRTAGRMVDDSDDILRLYQKQLVNLYMED